MTDDEAIALVEHHGGIKAVTRITQFIALLVSENERQNLIAPSTIGTVWIRHVADSIQLLGHLVCDRSSLDWVDIGTGGGFPGLVVALASDHRLVLVEPRRRRAEFLQSCCDRFGIAHRTTVRQSGIERVHGRFDIVSARAVASVEKLLHDAAHCVKPTTRWLLPRGRFTDEDKKMLSAKRAVFHVEQSLTDKSSAILIVDGSIAS